MTDGRVAKRYARALFQAARDRDILDAVDADLLAIHQATHGNARFQDFLGSPNTDEKDKIGLFEKVFGDRVTALTMDLLRLMLRKRRIEMLELVRLEFMELKRHLQGVVRTVVTSAMPLDDAHRTALIAKVEAETGKRVDPEFRVDPDLIGGLRVAVGTTEYDGSVHGNLQRLRQTILKDLLKQA